MTTKDTASPTLDAQASPADVTEQVLAADAPAIAKAKSADGVPSDFQVTKKGVYRLIEEKEGKDKVKVPKWFCSPLKVAALCRDDQSESWGALLQFPDNDRQQHEWAMPMSMLAAGGEEYRAVLLGMGLRIAPGGFGRDSLHMYISLCNPRARYRCVERVGWHGDAYVLPREEARDGEERVILQTIAGEHYHRVGGTADEWSSTVGKWAQGNSRLTLALCTAFAGPLLTPLGEESGGFNLISETSTGKTTCLVAAGSVWGSGGPNGFIRSWRTTDNAVEAVARQHNDCLLCLDEVGQAPPDVLGEIIYAVVNGIAKSRMRRDASLRSASSWRTMILSSGEVPIATRMSEARLRRVTRGGQEVRLVDVPADAGREAGVFDWIHGHSDGDTFARAIKAAALTHYGHAGRKFVAGFAANREVWIRYVKAALEDFVREETPGGASGQTIRAIRRFALIAAAGELAAKLEIVPWDDCEASGRVATCLQDWLATRDDIAVASDIEKGVRAVRFFLERFGDARFTWIAGNTVDTQTGITDPKDRAGFRRKESGENEWTYYVLPEVWRSEILAGFDATAIARHLAKRGWLLTGEGNHLAQKPRLPGVGLVRAYVLQPQFMQASP